jgi:hypothetical protein
MRARRRAWLLFARPAVDRALPLRAVRDVKQERLIGIELGLGGCG